MFEKLVKALKGDNNDVSTMLAKEKIPATKAYMVSKYGYATNREELLKEFFESARQLIRLKTGRGQYSAVMELNEDIKEYLPQIIDHYRTYGYNALVIDENTNISNEYNEKSSRITMTLLVLTWDSPKNIVEPSKEEKKDGKSEK